MDIVALLRNQAQEIAEEGHNGWGDTMTFAADEIETLRRHKNELAAQLKAAQQNMQPTPVCTCKVSSPTAWCPVHNGSVEIRRANLNRWNAGAYMSGYYEIGIYNGKTEVNIGTLWRSAYQLGASGIFTIGKRYQKEASDTTKAFRHIPMRHYSDFQQFKQFMPSNAVLVGVEMGGSPLSNFAHPKSCVYLLGAEDYGLPPEILAECNCVVSLESINQPSYNVAVAGSIVMYSRVYFQRSKIACSGHGFAASQQASRA